jgi:hypothetical protein
MYERAGILLPKNVILERKENEGVTYCPGRGGFMGGGYQDNDGRMNKKCWKRSMILKEGKETTCGGSGGFPILVDKNRPQNWKGNWK